MREMTLLAVFALVVSACGTPAGTQVATSSTSTAPQEATTTTAAVEKSAFLDFSAIQGTWVGVIGEAEDLPPIEVELEIETEARRGTQMGTAKFRSAGSNEVGCKGVLSALRVDNNRYQLFQAIRSGGCNWNGSVTLAHSPERNTIGYRLAPETEGPGMSGVLERVDG